MNNVPVNDEGAINHLAELIKKSIDDEILAYVIKEAEKEDKNED